jgi:site-specific DNA recombinase
MVMEQRNKEVSKRTGISYVRVSTEDQAKTGVSLENQTERIRQYAEYKQIAIMSEIRDEGISGGVNRSRAGFIELLDTAESGSIHVIILYSLERLSRDMLTLLALERLLDEYNVELHTIEGQIDTSTPDGYMNFAMKAFLAEMERRQVKYRTRKAMAHKKSKGHVTGSICYGYIEQIVEIKGREKPLKVLKPYEPEQTVIRIINDMYEAGEKLAGIVKTLNNRGITTRDNKPWTPQQVKRLIVGYQECFKKTKTRISLATRHFVEAIA